MSVAGPGRTESRKSVFRRLTKTYRPPPTPENRALRVITHSPLSPAPQRRIDLATIDILPASQRTSLLPHYHPLPPSIIEPFNVHWAPSTTCASFMGRFYRWLGERISDLIDSAYFTRAAVEATKQQQPPTLHRAL